MLHIEDNSAIRIVKLRIPDRNCPYQSPRMGSGAGATTAVLG